MPNHATHAAHAAYSYDASTVKQELINILSIEANSIFNLINHLPNNAHGLVEKIIQTPGKTIFSGNGKSGIVARKLAATFSSIGTPSMFIHPSDALHGDLGMIQEQDLFIALSKSGSGIEFEHIFRFLRSQKNFIALMCCDLGPLSKKSDLTIQLPLIQEACHLNLAPSSSSTLMIAFGDALAIVISKIIGFDKNKFAHFHPAGTLGKKLLLTVSSLMYSDDALPLLKPITPFQETILTISSKKLGVGIVVDHNKSLLGIVTDGDLRRACKLGPSVFQKQAQDIMIKQPKTIEPSTLAQKALEIMENNNITSLVVTTNKKVIGLIHIHDIIKTGLKG